MTASPSNALGTHRGVRNAVRGILSPAYSARAMSGAREAFDALILAARDGDARSVREMLGSEATAAHIAVLDDTPDQISDPVNTAAAGVTPLHIAALLGRLKCVDALIAAGAGVCVKTALDPCSATMMAAYSPHEGTTDIMCTLMRAGADLNERSEQGLTLMAAACSASDVNKVQVLLEAGAPVVSAVTHGNRTLLTTGVRIEDEGYIVMNTTSVLDKKDSQCYTVTVWRDERGDAQIRHERPDYRSSSFMMICILRLLCQFLRQSTP